MAKDVQKTATAETAFGEKLETAVTFGYTFAQLESYSEIPADEMPNQKAILGLVNAQRNAAARSKAQSEAFEAAGIKAPTLSDPEYQVKQMVKVLIAAGNSPDDALEMAKKVLGR